MSNVVAGLTDNDTGSSGEDEEDGGASHSVTVAVGVQTDDAGLAALLAGTAGKDTLMAAARQEILRLQDLNTRLLQQSHPGGSCSVVMLCASPSQARDSEVDRGN